MCSQAREYMVCTHTRMCIGACTHTHTRRRAVQLQTGGTELADPSRHSHSTPVSIFSVENLPAAQRGDTWLAGSGEGKLKVTEPVPVRGRLTWNPNLRMLLVSAPSYK